jgi:glycerate 2-kinase
MSLDEKMASQMRGIAQQIFRDTLAECSVEAAFQRHVVYERGILRVGEDLYNLNSLTRLVAVSIGKAAHTMAGALVQQLGARVGGFVASPVSPPERLPQFVYFHGGHPLPNEESVRAAIAVEGALKKLDQGSLVIFLLSGGGSAAFERPGFSQVSLDDLIETYSVLVNCGAPISEINAIRKHLSGVKGGRLAEAAGAARQVSIMISDVPDDRLDSLASGPTMPDSTTVRQCYEIVKKYDLIPKLPLTIRSIFEQKLLEETPKATDAAFIRARWWPILSSGIAAKCAANLAAAHGFAVEIDNTCDDWDYKRAADYLLEKLKKLRAGASRVCLISAGEVTVKLPTYAGTGGRNLQFALYCGEKIAGQPITVLSAGTDGVDGNSRAAGAVTDGSTLVRAHAMGLDAADTLRRFDAAPFFENLGDDIITGPTGNNVRDLRILLAY